MPKEKAKSVAVKKAQPKKKATVKKPATGVPKAHVQPTHEPEIARSESGSRILQIPERIWYKPDTWKNKPPVPDYVPLPKARHLFISVLKHLWANKEIFGGIVIIYGLLDVFLVHGIAGSSDISNLKTTINGIANGFTGRAVSAVASFGYLFANSGANSTPTSGVYQGVLLILTSLAFIWALRQVTAKREVRVRDSFYLGMYPLVPFLLLFFLMSIQLLPLGLGGGLYQMINGGGILVFWWEKAVLWLIFIALALWSLSMITASIFALYIVTLPDMTPLRAYRSAKQLVYGRRLLIWRKLIFLPVIMFLVAVVIEVPLIMLFTPLAVWVFFILSMLALPITHAYIYALYREML